MIVRYYVDNSDNSYLSLSFRLLLNLNHSRKLRKTILSLENKTKLGVENFILFHGVVINKNKKNRMEGNS